MTTKVKYNKELLEQICERDKCKVNYDKIERYNRDVKIEFTCSCGNNDSKNFRCMYKNGMYCDECMKIKSNQRKIKSYITKYGVSNPNKVKDVRDKIKQTNVKKYGVEYYTQSSEYIIKFKETCLKRYGVENPSQLQEFKYKQIQTNLNKYGVENANKTKETRDKIKQTCLNKYGFESATQTTETKSKVKETNLKKYGVEYYTQTSEYKTRYKNTCLDKYGVDNINKLEEIKNKKIKTSLKNHGVEYPMQNAEVSEKNSKNSYKLKQFTFPCGNTIKVQGYEPFLLNILVKEGYNFEEIITKRTDVPEIWYDINGIKKRYYCDIYIPKTNTIYEVKSTWTNIKNIDKNRLKKQACIDNGYNFQLYVFDNKGIRQLLG